MEQVWWTFSSSRFKIQLMISLKNNKKLSNKRGSLLIEVLIAAAIISTSMIAAVGVFGTMAHLAYRNTARVQASFLAEEGVEALKTLRNNSWNAKIKNLTLNKPYYLYWLNSSWNVNASSTMIDNQFLRYFTLSNVYRDSNFNIVASTTSGASIDTDMRQVTVNVDWTDEAGTSTKSITTYLYNLFAN
jgi:Tfp pilus assembly protein PilV